MSKPIKIANFEGAIYNKSTSARSAWERGVAKYALDILNDLEFRGITEINPTNDPELLRQCLNGADNWKRYSEGGCALICDFEIVERLGTPGEKRRYNAGRLDRPNPRESWLDCQARALHQAFALIKAEATTHARVADATHDAA